MTDLRVSVIMPALNEEQNLAGAVKNVLVTFDVFHVSGELLIVNDGSCDRTGSIAEEFAATDPRIRVIHHGTPQGIGASFWEGVVTCSGEIVVMLPGDGENDAAEILRYLPLLDQVDIVVPFVFNREVRRMGRRLLSILYREIIKASFGLALNYMNGTVMYRKAVFSGIELKNSGFFYQTELLIKTIKRGYLYAEVPYALRKRIGGDSKATSLRSLVKVAGGYLGMLREVVTARQEAGVVPHSATARRMRGLDHGSADT